MKRFDTDPSAFSLVEVTLALGVAAFSLLVILGMLPVSLKTNQSSSQQTTANGIISQVAADLRAAARLPPGQVSKQFSLHPHNGGPWDRNEPVNCTVWRSLQSNCDLSVATYGHNVACRYQS
jgi:Tfp pilus assembly protein PilV